MKKKYLLAVMLLSTFFVSAQELVFTDPMLKNLLVSSNCVDTDNNGSPDADLDVNNNGTIEADEAFAVQRLYIDGAITSLGGFTSYSFYSLKVLNIRHTLLNTISLYGFNSLDVLTIRNNAQLGALYLDYLNDYTAVDCSDNNLHVFRTVMCNNLTSINCSNNHLTNLNMTSMAQLESFNCSNNELQTVSLINTPNLTSFDCSNNSLTSLKLGRYGWAAIPTLDFSDNPGLTSVCCDVIDMPVFEDRIAQYGLAGVTITNGCTFEATPCPPSAICFADADFKFFLLTNTNTDSNLDGEIQPSEALAVTSLTFGGNMHTVSDLSHFTNLTSLTINGIQGGGTFDLTALTNLVSLNVNWNNFVNTININGLSQLTTLTLVHNSQLITVMANGLTALTTAEITSNQNLGSLSFPNSINLQTVDCSENNIATLNLGASTNLVSLNASQNRISTMTIGATTSLTSLLFPVNRMTSFNFAAFSNLQTLDFASNLMTAVNFTGLNSIQIINCTNNKLAALDASNLVSLHTLKCGQNVILSDLFLKNNNATADLQLVELQGNYSLLHICGDASDFPVIQSGVNAAALLAVVVNDICTCTGPCADSVVYIPNSAFKNKLLSSSPSNNVARNMSGQYFAIDANADNQIQRSEAANVYSIDCEQSGIASMEGINSFVSLNILDCKLNSVTSLDVSRLSQLSYLDCNINQMVSLNISGLRKIRSLDCGVNQLTTLDLRNFQDLERLQVSGNPALTHMYMKNGAIEPQFFCEGVANLEYVCVDEEQESSVAAVIAAGGNTTCVVNSYCSFTPGGMFYTIEGNSRFDMDNNGCNNTDAPFRNMRINVSSNSITNTLIADSLGDYRYYVQDGQSTVNVALENPDYFNVSPASFTVSFPDEASPKIQNFCITPNGTHPDLEVVFLPLNNARPGFESVYKIVYKNKGNVVQSGVVELNYASGFSQILSVNPAMTTMIDGQLTHHFTNLQPYEQRSILVRLRIHSPFDTEPVYAGQILEYTAMISSNAIDEMPQDNVSYVPQTVVSSLDPNDKTCLEGQSISVNQVGKYVHYLIRFENTGTANAENVVVRDMIDADKYDVSSIVPIDGSHPYITRITQVNKVEFIFENINLPFDDANNDGYLAFKIKTKPTLIAGDSFSNTAGIYFDYNLPVITEPAVTTVSVLAVQDFEPAAYFAIYPNPVKETVNIEAKTNVELNSVSLYNTLGQLILAIPDARQTKTFDVSTLHSGNYFLKLQTTAGSSVVQFVKQ